MVSQTVDELKNNKQRLGNSLWQGWANIFYGGPHL